MRFSRYTVTLPRRIGVIGDIHAQSGRLAAAIDVLRSRGSADCLVAVGDIVDGQGSVDACCDLLIHYGVLAVRGNHERWMFSDQMRAVRSATHTNSIRRRSRAFLASLPNRRLIHTSNGTLLVAHGIGDDDMRGIPRSPDLRLVNALRALRTIPDDCIAVVSGHAHQGRAVSVAGVMLIGLNSLRNATHSGCGVFDCVDRSMTFYQV